MALSEVAAGLIGAALGAGGAVMAQVVAQMASAKRDARRFDWERQQAADAKTEAQAQKFAERRLEVFSEILQGVRQVEDEIRASKDRHGEPRKLFYHWRESADQSISTVQILAPDVYLKVLAVGRGLEALFITLEQTQAGTNAYIAPVEVDANLRDAGDELRSAMRTALGIKGEEWIRLET